MAERSKNTARAKKLPYGLTTAAQKPMVDPLLSSQARTIAREHNLDDALVCAVIDKESSWNRFAAKYEPKFETAYNIGVTVSAQNFLASKPGFVTDLPTEIKFRCASWGLMQILGEVARELGYRDPIPGLTDPATGIEWGCKKLAACISRRGGDVYKGLQEYNGGADPSYAPDVINRMKGFVVVTGHANDL